MSVVVVALFVALPGAASLYGILLDPTSRDSSPRARTDPQVAAYSAGYNCGSMIPNLMRQFPRVGLSKWLGSCVQGARKDHVEAMRWDGWGIRDGIYDALGEPTTTIRYHCLFSASCGEHAALDDYWEQTLSGP